MTPSSSTTEFFIVIECNNGLTCFDSSTNECDWCANVDCEDRSWIPDSLTSTYGPPDVAYGTYSCMPSVVNYMAGSPGTAGENALKAAICICIDF